MSNNSIQSIQNLDTSVIQKVGDPVGKDGKYLVKKAFVTFQNDLKDRSSQNALGDLSELQYRKVFNTSSVGKFLFSLLTAIPNALHNLHVALDSSQPALNIGVPIETLRRQLIRPQNMQAIEDAFKNNNDSAKKFFRDIRKDLIATRAEIMEKLGGSYPKETRVVLELTASYIDDLIVVLSPNIKEEMLNDIEKGKQQIDKDLEQLREWFQGIKKQDVTIGIKKFTKEMKSDFEKFFKERQQALTEFANTINTEAKQTFEGIKNDFS